MDKKTYQKKYYQEHKEQYNEFSRRYRASHPNYYREWYAKNGRKRSPKEKVSKRNYYLSHKKVWNAKGVVYEALKGGLIEKPKLCYFCGRCVPLVAHHEDYKDPLRIVWVCGSCHKKIHSMRRG